MGGMALVDLDAIPQVALEFIDADHREEARLLNELDEAVAAHRAGRTGPEPVLACFEALFDHTREHFAREEEAMRRSGFPPLSIHRDKHERVLRELAEEGQAFGEGGDAARLANYVGRAVPAWFQNHILTMDLITARYVTTRGG
jgi:hemerythrin